MPSMPFCRNSKIEDEHPVWEASGIFKENADDGSNSI